MITINRSAINRSAITDIVTVIYGQSNIGNAPTSEAPGYITTSADIPNCTIWYPGDVAWSNLRLGVNGSHTGSPTSKELYAVTHELGYRLNLRYPTKNIRFIMTGKGGTPLNVSGSDNYWRSDVALQLFDTAKDTVTSALASLTDYIYLSNIWIHGESDTTTADNAGRYEFLERHFFDSWYRNFGKRKTLCSKISPNINAGSFPFVSTVNAGKDAVFALGIYDQLIDTSDNSTYPVSGDGLHYDGDGITALATDFLTEL